MRYWCLNIQTNEREYKIENLPKYIEIYPRIKVVSEIVGQVWNFEKVELNLLG